MKRQLLLWLLVIGFVWLVFFHLTEIQKLTKTLAEGQWQWVGAAALLQIVYYVMFAALYQAAFYTVELRSRLRDLLPVTFGAIVVNVMAPSGGASGAALFVDDAVRRGQSAARAAAGTVLVLATDFSAFLPVLIIGLIYLFLQHDLAVYELISALILLLMTGGLTGILGLGVFHPRQLHRLLHWLQGTANRLGSWLGRPVLLVEGWADRHAADFTQASRSISRHPRRLGRTLSVALISHLVNLGSLYLLFVAFQQTITVGQLVAGYAMGVLFLIVSPTPMGVGVVEGVMPLVFISLGVPHSVAILVTLAYRGLSFWLPLLGGFILLHRVKSFGIEERSQAHLWHTRLVASLTAVMGIINILSAVRPSLASRLALLEQFLPLFVTRGGHLTATLAGFALLVLAVSLWRRKRTAWLLTLVVLVISIISHIVKGLDYEEALLATGLVVWLITLRPYFHARSDLPSIRQGVGLFIGSLLFTLAYGVIGFYLLDYHFSVNFSWGAALRQTVIMFTQFYDPGLQSLTGFGRYFAASIYVVGAATMAYALFMLIQPVLVRKPATPADRAKAQNIVEMYGRSALARMTLFTDKSYYFSPGGSVVTYVAKGRTAVVLGDPIGPPEDAAAAINEFKAHCLKNDWLPAFYQTLPDYLEHYQSTGFNTLCIGHEAIVETASFSLSGKKYKSMRAAINRLVRLGYEAKVHQPPLRDNLLAELRLVSDEWLTMIRGREKRFSMGWFNNEYLRSGAVLAIHTPAGKINAFANIVTEYRHNEIAVDLMRHQLDTENGTMDFLFVSLFEWAKTHGYETVNLGLSPFWGVGQQSDDPMTEQTLRYIYDHLNQFYNFQGLHQFKEKFHPCWSPRYLAYPGPTSLPAVVLALNRASSGDDFIWQYYKDFKGHSLRC